MPATETDCVWMWVLKDMAGQLQDEDEQEDHLATAALDALASCSAKMAENHKEWSIAINRFSKSVDKVHLLSSTWRVASIYPLRPG